MPKQEPLVKYFVGGRRYHHIYCSVCEKYLGSTGPDEIKKPSREEEGSLKCNECREKDKKSD